VLTHLSVNNYTIVDNLELSFDSGMTVITGETGAGKSVIIDALGLAVGNRMEADSIGDYSDKTDISAVFDLTGCQDVSQWVRRKDFKEQGSNDCILRRVITKEGRSRGYINGVTCTLTNLRELGCMLLGIHSQHEYQALFKASTHRRLLDGYSGSLDLADNVKSLWKFWMEITKEIDQLRRGNHERAESMKLLRYQLEEFEQLAVQPDEVSKLENEQKLLASASENISIYNNILSICRDNDESNVLSSLHKCQQLLERLAGTNEQIMEAGNLLSSAHIQIEEADHILRQCVDSIDTNPETLEAVEQRLSDIYSLMRKHHIQPGVANDHHESMKAELASLDSSNTRIDDLIQERALVGKDYMRLSDILSLRRNKSSKLLASEVTKHLQSLGMPVSQFYVELTENDGSVCENGHEDVQFLIVSNPGASARPLQKVASGGELSRVSLAIQVITAKTCCTPTLIFDEVDVGIGGATAENTGALLRELGGHAQVVCITHQPQVASQGHQHLHVIKNYDAKKQKTNAEIKPLLSEQRVQEIARMLGGVTITKQTLAHAKEMIERV